MLLAICTLIRHHSNFFVNKKPESSYDKIMRKEQEWYTTCALSLRKPHYQNVSILKLFCEKPDYTMVIDSHMPVWKEGIAV